MIRIDKTLNNETGSTIVVALMIIAIISILAISDIYSSFTETRIASHDTRYKMAFYRADGGTELAAELLEQNANCAAGFANPTVGAVAVDVPNFWLNLSATPPTDSSRDFHFPSGYAPGQPHTNLRVGGSTALSTGGAIQMAAGYEGKGKGSAAAGAHIAYDIISGHVGPFRSQAMVQLQWRHVIGQEGPCLY
jgi:hypothetical protein